MPPRKETVSKDELNELRREIERNSQILVKQLLDKIEKLEDELNEVKHKYVNQSRNNDYNQRNDTTRSIEVTRPVFFGNNRDVHPIDFLNRLEEYFAIKQTYAGEKIIIVGDCLRNTALNWFTTVRFQMENYNDFKKAFMDEYWSREIQIQIWSQCLSIKQIPANENFREHFATWATRLRHLEVPRLSEQEIVKNIAKHYPGYLRAILVSLQERTILAAMKVLGEEGSNNRPPENILSPNVNQSNQGEGYRPTNDTNHHDNNRNQHQNNRGRYNNWNHRPPQNNNQDSRNNDWRNRTQINQINVERVNENVPETGNDSNQVQTPVAYTVNTISTSSSNISPYIQCEIEGEPIRLLVDTGATISVLTKEVIDKLIRKNNRIPIFPVTGVQISNAVGKKICKITKQIFCKCKIGEVTVYNNFIQIENLNERGIIGADILKEYKAQINFDNKTITWEIENTIYITPFSEKVNRTHNEGLNNLAITEEDSIDKRRSREKQQCEQLIEQYRHIYSTEPGRIKKFQCQIKIREGEPIQQRPYPVPMSKMTRMDDEIQRMLSMNIIEPSTSPWSSPIVGVEKKNGDIRLCLDARKINQRIIPDRECPTNIEEIFIKFKGAKYLSSIDLTSGYWQCELKPECREITAFLYRGRNYQFQVLPFGLVNSVAEFQKILDKVLGPELLEFMAIYVDDIHIMSRTFQEHTEHLKMIFEKFTKYNVKINIKKSHFLQQQIFFLGHIISEQGIAMDPEKTQTIQKFQPPQNKKQIQSFLGFINFYRKYIRDLSAFTSTLSKLLKKGTPWTWETEHEEAFNKIKQLFLEDIIIQYPDFNRPFFLSTDASRTHVGAELFQINADNKHQTLGFVSRTLNEAEQKYHTTELELLAIVFGCKKFRNYILGYPIEV